MLDAILKVIALCTFVAFIAFLPVFVPLPDLITVVVVVALMAVYDLLIYPVLRRRRRRLCTGDALGFRPSKERSAREPMPTD